MSPATAMQAGGLARVEEFLDLAGRWIDRGVMALDPAWGLSRQRARAALSAVRHYEAASLSRRTENWQRNSLDANGTTRTSLARLRDLGRDLYRNNGWARRGVQVICNNTVGWGITAAPAPGTAKGRAKKAAAVWSAWADSTTCDVTGHSTFSGLQRLAIQTAVKSGEALLVRRWSAPTDANPLGLQVQLLEADYIDSYRDTLGMGTGTRVEPGNTIVQGVEFDSRGRCVAYWIYEQHPGSIHQALRGFSSRRVPAEDVRHIFLKERPGQVRGISWLAAAIVALQDLSEYEDAALMRQKIAACFAAFVTDGDPTGGAIGEQDASDPKLETLEPGMISYLPPGREISFAVPPADSQYDNFTKAQLRRVAASLGVTYEDLTGDYPHSFSASRLARISHWANVYNWQWHVVIPQLCDPVWRWVMQAAVVAGEIDQVPVAQWSPPPMPMVEPDKEGLAYQRLMRAGVMTLPEVVRERGKDFADHVEEIATSNEALDAKGIWLDSDPRKTSAAGLTQERAGAGGSAAAKPKPEDAASAVEGLKGDE